jgi:hypothetical protein
VFDLGAAGGMLVAFAASLAGLIFLDLLLSDRGSSAATGALGGFQRGIRALVLPTHPLFRANPPGSDVPPASTTRGELFRPSSNEWGGSKSIADAFASIAIGAGELTVTSAKRPTKATASGGVSDHWTGSTNAYAYDLGGSVSQMDRAAAALMATLGIPWSGGAIVQNVTRFGYRLQILYRTNVGGNHFDHIHIGVRKGA